MRAEARSFGWEVETTPEDEETRVYFEPMPEITELAPQLEPEVPGERAETFSPPGVRSFEVDGTWRVPSLAPRPSYSPAIVAMAYRPEPTIRHARTFSRPAIGVFVAAVCVLVGIAVGGVLAATGHSRGLVEAAPAKVVMTPSAPAAPLVTPIEEIALPAPVPVAAAAVVAAAPTPLPEPQPTFVQAAPTHHHHHSAPAPAPAEAPAASGKLAVSSKPPCSIIIDGKDTGLVAPQRAIELAAGKHEITLVNAEQGIHLTAEVAITADRSTQLIRDFTN